MPGCPKRTEHPDRSHPEEREYPVLSLACRHPEMVGTRPEGTSRGWNAWPVGILRVEVLRPVLQLGSVMASQETLGEIGSGLVGKTESPE